MSSPFIPPERERWRSALQFVQWQVPMTPMLLAEPFYSGWFGPGNEIVWMCLVSVSLLYGLLGRVKSLSVPASDLARIFMGWSILSLVCVYVCIHFGFMRDVSFEWEIALWLLGNSGWFALTQSCRLQARHLGFRGFPGLRLWEFGLLGYLLVASQLLSSGKIDFYDFTERRTMTNGSAILSLWLAILIWRFRRKLGRSDVGRGRVEEVFE